MRDRPPSPPSALPLAPASVPELAATLECLPPHSWLGPLGMASLVGVLFAWLWNGELQSTLSGEGMLVRQGGLYTITAQASGTLVELAPLLPGDKLRRGQQIGRVAQPVLAAEVEGLAREAAAIGARFPPTPAELTVVQSRLKQAQARLAAASLIVSPYAGTLVERMAAPGMAVQAGQPLVSIEHAGEGLVAMLYLPADSRIKQVREGMPLRLSLADAPAERYGSLRGTVRAVSRYPASEAGMLAVFQHAALVRTLAQGGAVHAVVVALDEDAANASGYAWTRPAGARLALSSGTRVQGVVLLARYRPLDLLLPWLGGE